MQLCAIFLDQVIFNVELPQAEAEVIPGVQWGAIEAFPTPAYWAYQVYARRLTGNRINYKLGATLKEEVGACLLGGHGIPANVGIAAFHHVRERGAFGEQPPPEETILEWLREPLALKLGAMSGSQTVENLPDATAIKLSNNLPNKFVKISARYTSGEVTANSNDLYIEIIKPVVALHPHFDQSDTGRINLTGDWTIELGGVAGTMTIRQGTDNIINGSFLVPGGTWPAGAVTGHKDGKTFRAHFSIPSKESTETIRVAGYFDLTPPKGESIELEGCAYHLRKSPLTYNEGGAEGVECTVSSVFYDYWEVTNAVRFYAKAPFDKTD